MVELKPTYYRDEDNICGMDISLGKKYITYPIQNEIINYLDDCEYVDYYDLEGQELSISINYM